MKKLILFLFLVSIGMCFKTKFQPYGHYSTIPIGHYDQENGLEFIKETMLIAFPDYIPNPKIETNKYYKTGKALGALLSLKNRKFSLEEKEDILIFLESYSLRFLNDNSFILQGISYEKAWNKYSEGKITIYMPEIAIEVILDIDFERGLKFLEKIWNRYLNEPELNLYLLKIREQLIDKLFEFYKNDKALELTNKLKFKSEIPLIKRQIMRVEHMNFYNKLSKIESDSAAWDYLWNISHTKRKSKSEILDYVDWRLWSSHTIFMADIFSKTDLKPTLNRLKNAQTSHEKFIFLGCSCRMANLFSLGKQSPNDEIEALNFEDLGDLTVIYNDFFEQNPEYLIEAKGKNKSDGVIGSCNSAFANVY